MVFNFTYFKKNFNIFLINLKIEIVFEFRFGLPFSLYIKSVVYHYRT